MANDSPAVPSAGPDVRDAWDGAALVVVAVALVVFGLVGCWALVAVSGVLGPAEPRTTVEWAVRFACMLPFALAWRGVVAVWKKSSYWVRGRLARLWAQAEPSRSRTATFRTLSIVGTAPIAGVMGLLLGVVWHMAWSVVLHGLIAMGSR